MHATSANNPPADLPVGMGVFVDPGAVRRRVVAVERAILIAAAALTVVHCLYFFNQACDDAYISLAYARRWVQGRGLSLNDVAPSEGYSNLLWVMMLAGGMRVGLDGLLVAKGLGLACAVGVCLVGVRLVRSQGGGPWCQAAAGLFIAGSTPLAAWSCQGLETPLYALEVTVLALTVSRLRRWAGRAAFILVVVATVLTRPEGIFVAGGLCVALRIFGRRNGPRRAGLATCLIVLALVVGAHQVFRLTYFGQWTGNSTVHKWHPLAAWTLAERGVDRAEQLTSFYFSKPWPALWGVLLLPLLVRRVRRRIAPTVLLLMALSAFHVLVGGDLGPYFRFLVPTTALVAALLPRLGELLPKRVWRGRLRLAGPVLTGVLAVSGAVSVLRWVSLPGNFYACPSVIRPTAHDEVADWLKQHARPGDRVLLSEMGLIPYATDLPCFDYLGLCDRLMYGPGVTFNADRYDKYRPRFVVMNVNVLPDGMKTLRLPAQAEIYAQPGFVQEFVPAVEMTLDKDRSLMEYGYYANRPDVREVRFVIFVRRAPTSRGTAPGASMPSGP